MTSPPGRTRWPTASTIRVEHWTNAAEQGTHAGRNALAAEPKPYEAVPYFWSDQYDVKIQAAGLPARAQRVELIEPDVAVGLARRPRRQRRHLQRAAPADALPPPDRRPCPRLDDVLMAAHDPRPPARRVRPARAARRVARSSAASTTYVSDSRDNPRRTRATSTPSPASAAATRPPTLDVPQVAGRDRADRAGRRARRPRARPVLRRPGARARARRARSRPRPRPSSAGARSRPTSRTRSPPARGCCGTTSASRSPPGATEVARTKDATQAFRHGPHLGLQFHPESTTDIVDGWARKDAREACETIGVTNGPALIEAPDERKEAAKQAAFRLFDAFRGESA